MVELPIYDTIVIGIGMAGLTAAVYTARAGLKTLVIGDIKDSMFADAENVGNYIGLNHKTGIDILERGIEQVKEYGAEVIMPGEIVNSVQEEETKTFKIKTSDAREFRTKTLILATGTQYKKSGAEGEEAFKGKGVHYCVSCDGFFYKGKTVAIVGHGNLAAEEAIEMTGLTPNVALISQRTAFEITPQLMEELKKKNVKMITGKAVSIKGKERVESLQMADGSEMSINAVFVAMGTATGLDFSNKLGIIMDEGFLVIDRDGKTNLEGVYAAGSCTGGNVQVAKSVGEGCNAGVSAIKFVKGIKTYVDQT